MPRVVVLGGGIVGLSTGIVFRAFIEMTSLYALPQEVLARPGLAGRIAAVAAEHEEVIIPGLSRAGVLGMLA